MISRTQIPPLFESVNKGFIECHLHGMLPSIQQLESIFPIITRVIGALSAHKWPCKIEPAPMFLNLMTNNSCMLHRIVLYLQHTYLNNRQGRYFINYQLTLSATATHTQTNGILWKWSWYMIVGFESLYAGRGRSNAEWLVKGVCLSIRGYMSTLKASGNPYLDNHGKLIIRVTLLYGSSK